MQQQQPITPVIVQIVDKPTTQVGVSDILIDALGLTGLLLLGAAMLGLLFGWALIWFKFKRPGARDSKPAASDYGFRLSAP